MKVNDVIINKTQSIKKCVSRAREDYFLDKKDFFTNFMQQDSAMMNIQRACEQAIDLASHVISLLKLPFQQSETRDIFLSLAENKIISDGLANELCKMVGFRNITVHQYQKIDLKIVESVIEKNLDSLLEFAEEILNQHDKIQSAALKN